MKKNIKGFTLIELLVVIAIIGLLSTLAVVSLNSARTKARDARRQSDLRQISTAMELYHSQTDNYPVDNGANCGDAGVISTDASTVCKTGAIKDGLTPPNTYLQQIPKDPTDTSTYYYKYNTSDAVYGATSYCISAQLEVAQTGGDFFVCLNGSCYIAASGC